MNTDKNKKEKSLRHPRPIRKYSTRNSDQQRTQVKTRTSHAKRQTNTNTRKTSKSHHLRRKFSYAQKELPMIKALSANSKDKPVVRIIPIGGVEEIGRNMTAIEYGDDIIVIDAGLQFPEEETPGIDYIIPNTKYLEENKGKVRGLVISHGHLDHTGAVPYIMEKIGNPTLYTTKLTKAMILKKQAEFPHVPKLDIEEVTPESKVRVGKLRIKFFAITHTIPDAIGIIIETPLGNVLYPGDFKIEVDAKGIPKDIAVYEKLGKENNLILLLESTNAEMPGFSLSEKIVSENLDKIIGEAKGRVLIGTFASLLERIIEITKIADKYGRRVAFDGRGMRENLEISKELGIFIPKKSVIIPIEDIDKFPPHKILMLCTGAQGEENATLNRIASKRHKNIKIQKDDMVILSSSVIPGNEKSVQNLKDNLARQGAEVIHYRIADVHASGHAYQEESKLMIQMIKPKFFIPVHGHYFMLMTNAKTAKSIGIPEKNIITPMNNGAVIECDGKTIMARKEVVPSNYIMVDGLGVGDVKEVVLRDRQMLAQDGIFVIIIAIDAQTGKVKNSPDIISRGFVYLKESQDLLRSTRHLIKKSVEETTGKMHPINISYVKDNLRERVAKHLFQKTKRRPMVLPVIIEV